MAIEIVTKAELSRILGVSRARVTQYANMGMPVLSDGKLDLAACFVWLRQSNFHSEALIPLAPYALGR